MSDIPGHAVAVSQQGHYAGAVTRCAAFVVDQAVASAVFTATVAALQFVIDLVTEANFQADNYPIVIGASYFGWLFVYYAYSWATAGKTLGMSLVGLRVVRSDGAAISARQAALRTIALPLSFLLFGLGFLGILIGKHRRALHDVIANTAVVYGWDARAAQLRFLASGQVDPVPVGAGQVGAGQVGASPDHSVG
jgi:uncharacterized RDD family membrane protein YckC